MTMESFRTVRFNLRDLVMAVGQKTGDLGLPISEVFNKYYGWAHAAGWRLHAMMGIKAENIFVVTAERSDQRVMVQDEIITVVWKGGDDLQTPDYVEAYPPRNLAGFMVYLEDHGWELCEDRDGYWNERASVRIDGTALTKISDSQLIRAVYPELEKLLVREAQGD
jgi:hypothetical protein